VAQCCSRYISSQNGSLSVEIRGFELDLKPALILQTNNSRLRLCETIVCREVWVVARCATVGFRDGCLKRNVGCSLGCVCGSKEAPVGLARPEGKKWDLKERGLLSARNRDRSMGLRSRRMCDCYI
jgi:hypothetical protein